MQSPNKKTPHSHRSSHEVQINLSILSNQLHHKKHSRHTQAHRHRYISFLCYKLSALVSTHMKLHRVLLKEEYAQHDKTNDTDNKYSNQEPSRYHNHARIRHRYIDCIEYQVHRHGIYHIAGCNPYKGKYTAIEESVKDRTK